jgi:hypothetical protein
VADDAARRFRNEMNRLKSPHEAVAAIFGPTEDLVPIIWANWDGTRYRHAGAHDPRLRLREPNVPDVKGLKYRLVGSGAPPRRMDLMSAIQWLLDRGDEFDTVIVDGSHRPVVSWQLIGNQSVPRIDFVGASVLETRAIESSGVLPESNRDMVILRIRMSRRTLRRIKDVASYEQQLYKDGRKGKYMSAAVLGAILSWLDEREKVITAVRDAGFSGSAP